MTARCQGQGITGGVLGSHYRDPVHSLPAGYPRDTGLWVAGALTLTQKCEQPQQHFPLQYFHGDIRVVLGWAGGRGGGPRPWGTAEQSLRGKSSFPTS